MTIVLPEDYHAKKALEARRILCISREKALSEDIRALRVGVLNIMPEAQNYEFSLLFPMGRSVIQIEPVWLRLKMHKYKSTSHQHLENLYVTFEEATTNKHLDGLIVTGAPIEDMPFEEVHYWPEIIEILTYARKNIASTLGICWGGLTLAKVMGIEKEMFEKKIFGIFEGRNINREHKVTGEMDDVFWCPHSRYSGISDKILEKAKEKGIVNLLAHSDEAGYFIFESADERFLIHLGHFEYEADRIIYEYNRDLQAGKKDIDPPQNMDVLNPVNRWRAHCLEFFTQWIKYIHEFTPY